MSFEIKIVAPELAEALNNLAAAIAARPAQAPANAPVEAAPAEKPKGTRVKKDTAPEKPAQTEETGSSDTAIVEPEAASAVEASTPSSTTQNEPEVEYADVQKRVLALAKVKREHATDLLAEFGVANGKDLTPDQWPEFVQAADDKLKEIGLA